MIKGKTTTGFEFEIDETKLDDWELLEKFNAIDKGETGMFVDVANDLLGKKQMEKLKKHVKKSVGKVSVTGMVAELSDIFTEATETKN